MNKNIQWDCCDLPVNFSDFQLLGDRYNPIVCCSQERCRLSMILFS